jgi:hypothetical protein
MHLFLDADDIFVSGFRMWLEQDGLASDVRLPDGPISFHVHLVIKHGRVRVENWPVTSAYDRVDDRYTSDISSPMSDGSAKDP